MKRKNWKRRTIIVLLIIPIILTLAYYVMGAPVLTAEQSFRRAEKEHALGPATILGMESILTDDYGYHYDTLIVAETKYGAMLYCTELNTQDRLFYREKSGPFTVMALPNGGWSWLIDEPRQLNVVLFDDHPEAVRAELELIVDWPYDFHGFTPEGVFYHYRLNAERTADGYFHFVHTIYGSDYIDNDNVAMRILTDILSKQDGGEEYYWDLEIPANIQLYDGNGHLIIEESTILRSVIAEEHSKHGQ